MNYEESVSDIERIMRKFGTRIHELKQHPNPHPVELAEIEALTKECEALNRVIITLRTKAWNNGQSQG